MASIPQICNMALAHIGDDSSVSSISPPDGTAAAGHCARFYGQARTEMLEPGAWKFSKKRALLAQVANPSEVWLYAYGLPSDCLRPLRVLNSSYAHPLRVQPQYETFSNRNDLLLNIALDEENTADFQVEGNVVFTNQPEAVLLYVVDIVDTTKFTPSFTTALSYLLASYLAGPIVKGTEGTRLAKAMRDMAMNMARGSATADANASNSISDHVPEHIAARL